MRKLQLFFVLMFCISLNAMATQIIAHRGNWKENKVPQNSIAALKEAHRINVYGSEMDIYITADDVVVVSHDNDIWGLIIEESKLADLKKIRMQNGEPLPTFEEYLKAHKDFGGDTKLIVEIKEHKLKENNIKATEKALELVKKYDLESKVDYISFNRDVCVWLTKKASKESKVFYLGGDLSPAQVKKLNIGGIDYMAEILLLNPEWIKQAQKLGIYTAIWSLTDDLEEKKMKWFIDRGIDFITTDNPSAVNKMCQ
jgi:glycerophosphoryl diester phosphodiesterase